MGSLTCFDRKPGRGAKISIKICQNPRSKNIQKLKQLQKISPRSKVQIFKTYSSYRSKKIKMPPSSRRIRQVSFKNEAILNVNIESLDSLYDQQGTLDAKFKFTIRDGYEEKFCGSLIITDYDNGDSTVDILMKKNYKNLKATWINLTNDHFAPRFIENLIPLVNGSSGSQATATMTTRPHPQGRRIAYRTQVTLIYPPQRFLNLRGTLKLSFEPKIQKGRIQKRRLTSELNKTKLNSEAEDFTIICQDQQFGFNRFYLSMISPVFEKMQSERWKKEDTENNVVSVEEKDFPPET